MKYRIDCFTDSNNSEFSENTFGADDVQTVAEIISNCTRKIAGINKVVVKILEKDDRPAIRVLGEKMVREWVATPPVHDTKQKSPELKPVSKMDEMVLAFSADALKPIGMDGFTGFIAHIHGNFLHSKEYLDSLSFVRRGDAEQDETKKQIIPYWVVVDPASTPMYKGDDKILCYVRGKKSGENRLIKKASIGIGGHISKDDVAGANAESKPMSNSVVASIVYSVGSKRELNEEVKIDCEYASSIVGLLNDNDTPVGRVHFGVVHVAVPDDPKAFGPNEADVITEFSWKTVEELKAMNDSLEGWSQICLNNLGVIVCEARRLAQWRKQNENNAPASI